MENLPNNGKVIYSELDTGGGIIECPSCHAILRPHLGHLMATKFECENCKVDLSYMHVPGRTVRCPCCNLSRPAPNSLQVLICGGCHVTIVYEKGDQAVKCSLCNQITTPPQETSGIRPVNRGPPPFDHVAHNQVVPPQVNHVVHPQANPMVPPQVNHVVPPQAYSVVPPQVNHVVHPQANWVVPPQANQLVLPQANRVVRRRVYRVVPYQRNQVVPTQVNQVIPTQVNRREEGESSGSRSNIMPQTLDEMTLEEQIKFVRERAIAANFIAETLKTFARAYASVRRLPPSREGDEPEQGRSKKRNPRDPRNPPSDD